ncbi:twin-arginine translocase subunit TatC [Natranaeroarchaeum sulfidigenes]|uniref:Sec-independent protein translocase protein TatC n=1 Tax=Natranaeroarchaeum sulfidigenes TaxID=2784880 RepID=A0A897MUV8_9EURY|nr:twin-arginine translocase subunit TatC [Natranaeroarchaeum sulfidigenes]QSG04267.1 Sec-independent protein secretion pathway component TatC [Natranaeroarchaeum sulfidigenes]
MSSAVDEDTAQTIAEGRETIGGILTGAQKHLQKAFMAFVIGMMATIWAMRIYVWDFLEANTTSRMSEAVAANTDIVVRTPFDVILLQIKIGLVVGALCTIPVLVYYGRDAILERAEESIPINQRRIAGFVIAILGLFVGGIVYAYAFFFPFMFDFLATNATNAGIKPSYGIVRYTEFIILLTLSFGLAAQLPLAMAVLSYTEIVSYETFRDKWKYAVLGIFVFGMIFSPPDPFTQIMWGVPLVTLYAASLGLAKVITNIKRAGQAPDPVESGKFRRKAGVVGVATISVFVSTLAFLALGGIELLNAQLLPRLPDLLHPGSDIAVGGTLAQTITALQAGILTGLLGIAYYTLEILKAPVQPKYSERGVGGPAPASAGDPAEIDLGELDAAGIRSAPPEAFAELSENEALGHAQTAMEADNPEKAQAILDRFDEAEEAREAAEDADAATADTDGTPDEEDDSDIVTDTATGMLNPFFSEEKDEDDIGGYFYDIRFIVESLTSKMFRIFGVFTVVFVGLFMWLYSGGIGLIREQFLARVPPELRTEVQEATGEGVARPTYLPGVEINETFAATDEVIALHPVEVLIFEVQVSGIIAFMAVLPMILYYAWPALEERGLVSDNAGSRSVFYTWGAYLFASLIGGSLLGFFFIAPAIISWLVADAVDAGMIVAFRLRNFFWMVFFLTAGIGLLANIPMTMWLFARNNIISFEAMYSRWRIVTITIFALSAAFSPGGLFTMLLLAIPIALAYLIGLAILWMLTLPRRKLRRGGTPS